MCQKKFYSAPCCFIIEYAQPGKLPDAVLLWEIQRKKLPYALCGLLLIGLCRFGEMGFGVKRLSDRGYRKPNSAALPRPADRVAKRNRKSANMVCEAALQWGVGIAANDQNIDGRCLFLQKAFCRYGLRCRQIYLC